MYTAVRVAGIQRKKIVPSTAYTEEEVALLLWGAVVVSEVLAEVVSEVADPEVEELVKAADKLSAHIKCIEELKAGNNEFRQAAAQTAAAMDAMRLPELDYFREHFLPSYSLTLDELE